MTNLPQLARQGAVPVFQQVTDWQEGEVIQQNNPQQNVIVLNVPRALAFRKFYLYFYSNATVVNDNAAYGVIRFLAQSSVVGTIPISIGISKTAGSVIAKTLSVLTSTTAGGQSGQDQIAISPASPQAGLKGIVNGVIPLAPTYLYGQYDQICIDVSQFVNVSWVRIYAACMSSVQF